MGIGFVEDELLWRRSLEIEEEAKRERPLFLMKDIKFPLSTRDWRIVDATGRRVKLAGGNWSGSHMCRHCVDGLECQPLRKLVRQIRDEFRMNVIRFTYSLQSLLDKTPVDAKYTQANPNMQGKTPLQIMDETIAALTEEGVMVFLNNHTSSSMWCCSNSDGDGLWWTHDYPEYVFFECAEMLAQRYCNNPGVIGMDLRNEIRKAHGRTGSWGDKEVLTDWRRAAEICAEKVHKICPHWLIVIGGINYQLDLSGVYRNPIRLTVPNKLVYSGHFYGFSWPVLWAVQTYEAFKKKIFGSQTFVRSLGYPFILGQFGSNTSDTPWKYLMRYLKETDIDWTYWALDGFKCKPSEDETFGVWTNDFASARHPDLLADMIRVGPPCPEPRITLLK